MPDNINFGVRRLVKLLQKAGLRTTDSGDGYPYVVIACDNPYNLPSLCDHLRNLLRDWHKVDIPARGSNEGAPSIQGSYDPGNGVAIIELIGVRDEDLSWSEEDIAENILEILDSKDESRGSHNSLRPKVRIQKAVEGDELSKPVVAVEMSGHKGISLEAQKKISQLLQSEDVSVYTWTPSLTETYLVLKVTGVGIKIFS